MRSTKLTIDPLWNCLCPSWNIQGLNPIAQSFSVHRAPTRALKKAPTSAPHKLQRTERSNFSTCLSRPRIKALSTGQATYNAVQPTDTRQPRQAHTIRSSSTLSASDQISGSRLQARRAPVLLDSLQYDRAQASSTFSRPSPFGRYHDKPPKRHLKPSFDNAEELAREGRVSACLEMVQTLVSEGEKPHIALYNALILANINAEDGAAWRVHMLLREMEDEGVPLDQTTCNNVLKVLAVHPDHLLRTDIQNYMRENWLPMEPEAHHDITVGLLREGCFEMALDKLDMMNQEGIKVEPWLLDMFAYMLSDSGEMEVVYRMMRSRWENQDQTVSTILWYWLLDTASAARYYPMTEFIWRTQVELDFIQASSGMCINVMSTAARAGDPALATDAFRHMTRRGDKSTAMAYQLLIDSYMTCTPLDVNKALSVLSIMVDDKLKPSPWQTRSLCMHLQNSYDETREAFEHLRRLQQEGKVVPIAAINLIIECFAMQQNMSEAIKVYKQIHTFAPADYNKSYANIETFNILIKGCRLQTETSPEQIGFVVSEMLASRVQPNAITYDRLMLVFKAAALHALGRAKAEPAERQTHFQACLHYLEVTMKYFHELQGLGWQPRLRTLEAVIECLADVGDARSQDLLQYAEEHWHEDDAWMRRRSRIINFVKERLRVWDSATLHGDDALNDNDGTVIAQKSQASA